MIENITNIGSTIDFNNNLDKTALIDLSSETPRLISYGQLNAAADAVARGLTKKGISVGENVAIISDNSYEYLTTFFGILRYGAVAVLINNKISSSQIETILKESETKLIFTDGSFEFDFDSIDFRKDFESFLDWGEFKNYIPEETDIAFLLYTSGSSGSPKGATITHKRHSWILSRYRKHDKKWADKRVSLISAPLYHANGLTTTEISIYGHATIVLMPKFDAVQAIQITEEYNVNTIYCVPTMISMMIQEKDIIEKHDLSCVRQIKSASSAVGQKLLDNMKKYFPNAVFFNSYGITEVGPALFGPHPTGITRPLRSVGYPAEEIEYRLVDNILHIKSPSMMTTYYKKGKIDSITEDGFFVTNDIFEVDENGFYYFVGRNDDMFKCGANKVYPSEVESIIESHPAVSSAFVLSLPDEIKGEKPYAFVILEKGKTVLETDLKNYCLNNGPAYQHPRRIWFLDQMPLAGTNKINKKELKRMAIENLANQK
jgi:acyl-CoA synthetase (AMP-forming)/AMP-acid ligase II